MKKLFSNPRFLHGFYLSCLFLLWYCLWNLFPNPKILNSFKNDQKTFRYSNEILSNKVFEYSQIANYLAKGYRNPTTFANKKKVDSLINLQDNIVNFINNLQRQNFSQNNLYQIYNQLITYKLNSDSLIGTNNLLQIKRGKAKELPDINLDKKYWNNLYNLPKEQVLVELERLKSDIYLFSLYNIKFLSEKNTYCGNLKSEAIQLTILPNSNTIQQGEKFKADACIINYFNNIGSNANLEIDGTSIPFKDGIAHFEKQYNQIGTQSFTAVGKIKNPLTGEIKLYTKDFTFEVLPK
jgi:hypothetical protein